MQMQMVVLEVPALQLSLFGEMQHQQVKISVALDGTQVAAGVVHIVLVLAVLVVTVVVATALVVIAAADNQV
jgi:hypothetical protein